MSSRRPIPVAVLITVVVAASSSPVHAGFVNVVGDGNILNPATTATGATPDFFNDVGANRVVHGWAEKQNFTPGTRSVCRCDPCREVQPQVGPGRV